MRTNGFFDGDYIHLDLEVTGNGRKIQEERKRERKGEGDQEFRSTQRNSLRSNAFEKYKKEHTFHGNVYVWNASLLLFPLSRPEIVSERRCATCAGESALTLSPTEKNRYVQQLRGLSVPRWTLLRLPSWMP